MTPVDELGGHAIAASASQGYDRHGTLWSNTTWFLVDGRGVETKTSHEPRGYRQRVELGTIARLEHLVASLPTHIEQSRRTAAELEHTTITQARRVMGKPFKHADDLAAARTRYADLTALLADIKEQPQATHPNRPGKPSPPHPDPHNRSSTQGTLTPSRQLSPHSGVARFPCSWLGMSSGRGRGHRVILRVNISQHSPKRKPSR